MKADRGHAAISERAVAVCAGIAHEQWILGNLI